MIRSISFILSKHELHEVRKRNDDVSDNCSTATVPMIFNDSCSGRGAMVGERGERRTEKYLNTLEGERHSTKCLNIQHQIDAVS